MNSGFIALVGLPNVGKSSLLNALAGSHLAGVSSRAQTTRKALTAVVSHEEGQAVFVDTPGYLPGDELLTRSMRAALEASIKRSDAVFFVVDPRDPYPREKQPLEDLRTLLQQSGKKTLVVPNKMDLYPGQDGVDRISKLGGIFPWDIVPVSAKKGSGIALLLRFGIDFLPSGEPLYPEGQLSDMPERFFVEEALREASLEVLREEVPHATGTEVEEFKEREEDGPLYIRAVLYVEKTSQKKIWIGEGGATIKTVGRKARTRLEAFFGRKVYLELWVKVAKNWRRDENWLSRLGFEKADKEGKA